MQRNRAWTTAAEALVIWGMVSWGLAADRLDKPLEVAEGYTARLVSSPDHLTYPMFACWDDQGRLYVAESSGEGLYDALRQQTRLCKIVRLADTTGDGNFDQATTFADRLVCPMGLAWRQGTLYVADPPKLVALTDTTGDGQADQRVEVLGDFGHQDNGSLHGLVFGPDDRLYMTMGTPDGFQLREQGEVVATGVSGALIRCRPDGSEPEVLCRGFENLVEVDFWPDGAILGTNNWHQKPLGGIRDCFLHLVPGGIYPRHPPDGEPRFVETGELLPAIRLYPAVAISGTVRRRMGQPSDSPWHELLSAQFNTRKVVRHRTERDGSSFTMQETDLVASESPFFRPSDVLEDADGSLLVIDTGLWYVQHCATSSKRRVAGGIYRIQRQEAARIPDPWGRQLDLEAAEPEQLVAWLSDNRWMVAQRAGEQLAQRTDEPSLAALVAHVQDAQQPHATRLALVWIAARRGGGPAEQALARVLETEQDAILKSAAARALGLNRVADARGALERVLIDDARPAVRLAVAEALARVGTDRSLPAVWQALSEPDVSVDRMLEHALIYAAHRVASDDDLRQALTHEQPAIQQAALILLDQAQPPVLTEADLLARATAQDPRLRETALRLMLRRGGESHALLQAVEGWLTDESFSSDRLASVLEALQHEARLQQTVAELIAGSGGEVSLSRRLELLEFIGRAVVDPVPEPWQQAVGRLLDDDEPRLVAAAAGVLVPLRLTDFDDKLARLVEREGLPLAARLEALRALVARQPALSDARHTLLLAALDQDALAVERLAAVEVLLQAEPTDDQLVAVIEALDDDLLVWPTALPAFARGRGEALGRALVQRLDRLLATGAWTLEEAALAEVLANYPEAVSQAAAPLMERIRQRGAQQAALLERYRALLDGGDAARGREVFFGERAACGACHRVEQRGGLVGPDLSRIGAIRAADDLLESVVLPSAAFTQGYQTYTAIRHDGRVHTGVMARLTSDQDAGWTPSRGLLVLRDASGQEHRLRHDEIDELVRSNVSLMPEGLLQKLEPDEIRHLFAYLKGLR